MKITCKKPIDLKNHFIPLSNIGYNLGRVLLQILHIQMGKKDPYLYKKRETKTLNQTEALAIDLELN